MEAPTTQPPAKLPGRKRSPSPKSKRQTPPKQHDVQIIEPEPLPAPYQVGQPRLSTFETALVNTLPLTYFSSIWWVGTQTGVWSGVLVYGLRKAILQKFGGEQLRKYYMALAAYWVLNLLYHEKKVLQLHICWSFCITNFLCVAEKTCNAKIIRENRKETRLRSISCMRKVVSVASLA